MRKHYLKFNVGQMHISELFLPEMSQETCNHALEGGALQSLVKCPRTAVSSRRDDNYYHDKEK